jgi:hypothetical protein
VKRIIALLFGFGLGFGLWAGEFPPIPYPLRDLVRDTHSFESLLDTPVELHRRADEVSIEMGGRHPSDGLRLDYSLGDFRIDGGVAHQDSLVSGGFDVHYKDQDFSLTKYNWAHLPSGCAMGSQLRFRNSSWDSSHTLRYWDSPALFTHEDGLSFTTGSFQIESGLTGFWYRHRTSDERSADGTVAWRAGLSGAASCGTLGIGLYHGEKLSPEVRIMLGNSRDWLLKAGYTRQSDTVPIHESYGTDAMYWGMLRVAPEQNLRPTEREVGSVSLECLWGGLYQMLDVEVSHGEHRFTPMWYGDDYRWERTDGDWNQLRTRMNGHWKPLKWEFEGICGDRRDFEPRLRGMVSAQSRILPYTVGEMSLAAGLDMPVHGETANRWTPGCRLTFFGLLHTALSLSVETPLTNWHHNALDTGFQVWLMAKYRMENNASTD